MSIKGKAYIAGIYEHPTRLAKDISLAQLHAQSARGALEDAGLSKEDVDGYFCAGDAPGLGPMSMVEYMGLKVRHVDSTDTGGSSYVLHVGHAAEAQRAVRAAHDRHHVAIQAGCRGGVQRQFAQAEAAARLDRGEIQERQRHRLFQLPDRVRAEENQRDMRLHRRRARQGGQEGGNLLLRGGNAHGLMD